MSRIFLVALTLTLFTLIISCSSTQQTAQSPVEEQSEETSSSIYPAWYSSSSEFISTDSTFTAYGIAAASDSANAAQQAIRAARTNLEKHLSSGIEEARKGALQELGENSGLGSRSFIFALRNAETAISGSATLLNSDSNVKEELSTFNGFASVSITKEELAAVLSQQLSSNKNAWEVLRTSQAFENL